MKNELKRIGKGVFAVTLSVTMATPSKIALELGHAPPAALGALVASTATSTSTFFTVVSVPNTTLEQVYEVEVVPPGRFQVTQPST
jgi:hypothetical protein